MADDNKTLKYARYAIGEIALVVIGILIALSINNWNVNRINHNQEQQILLQLKSEYEENLKELDNKIEMRKHMIKASHRIISIKEGILKNIPADTIASDLFDINNTPTFDPVVGTTNELLSSGKLYIISNSSLKTMLTNWSGQVNRLTEYEQDLRNYNMNYFDPYLTKNYSKKNLFNGIWLSDLSILKPINKNSTAEAIISDNEIDDYILTISSLCVWADEEALNVRKNIESILNLINLEIND